MELTQELYLKRVPMYIGIVIKIIFRYRGVPLSDGVMNIFILKALKDISIQSSS